MKTAGIATAGRIFAAVCGLTMTGMACAEDDFPDTELLEFLGDSEVGDEEWQAFFDSIPEELTDDPHDSEMRDRSKQRDSD
jgi:hypothetical protein